MRSRKLLCALIVAVFSLQSLQFAARADEGMWTFNNVPRAEIKSKYGFDVTDAWLKKVQLASVRFNNGGSGSFVSPDGLVLTNYHIVEDIVGEVSTPQKDLAKEGFVARTRAEEIKAPSLELNVLDSIEDVTARINAAVKPGVSDADAFTARRAEISAIEAESLKATGLRSDVVTLYQGGRYNLYRYKKYTDVRLAFVPEFQSAFFGGDPDNFNFPRFNIDMALVRVYENNKPVKPPSYFKWSRSGAKENELVFVAGHPGSTARLNVAAHLVQMRDHSIPIILRLLERREAMLKKYMAMGAEQHRQGQGELNSAQNSLKVYRGQLAGLKDPELLRRKEMSELILRKLISTNPERQKMYGDAWDSIAKAHAGLPSYIRERRIFDQGAGFNTAYFGIARNLVRMAAESEKPNAQRLPEFTDARRASLELSLYSPAPIHDDFEKLKLADSLEYMVELLGADSAAASGAVASGAAASGAVASGSAASGAVASGSAASGGSTGGAVARPSGRASDLVQQILNGKTPQERAKELIEGTKLKDVAFRKELAAGGTKAIEASTDPMIVLARTIDPKARELRSRYESEITGVERANYAKIARARFENEGDKLYPDATFTLRLSYGAVKGYTENGKKIAPFTTLGGLYDRAVQFKSEFPYVLPPRWLEKKSSVDLKTPFNFVSTNDIIGGNSGSPTINKNAELVGLIFDGNIQSLVGDFYYDESVNRAISVDSRGMLEILRKVFNANELADELVRR